MSNDKIKEAFTKVKKDLFNLQSQILELKLEIQKINRTLETQTLRPPKPDNQTPNPDNQTHISTGNRGVSTGNEGVQTDRQTIRQTDRHIQKFAQSVEIPVYEKQIPPLETPEKPESKIDQIEKVSQTLNALDDIRKDLRIKFKKLTEQEMLVFSTIYQLENDGIAVDYLQVSNKIGLSQSSIRDYVQKIIQKGVPLEKKKENNKKVAISIPEDLKKMANLSTIMRLREI